MSRYGFAGALVGALAGVVVGLASAVPAGAEEVGCVTTAWKLLGANHRVCVEAFDDPKVPGVACHLSQARTGGVSGSLGLAEDPSRFSIACRQIGPITVPDRLRDNEEVFTADTSILFKETRVVRMFDRKRNTLVYLSYSTKMVDGSPMNAVSTVPIMPWRD
ncbi:CreA family protein [Skermanella rosea]|uniref:CreA family protein n=1 Tax=Skermanella rosea TaxID=1817965 RepID=UPI00193129C3|nr:CreA family protein [Skermanella rosea]UEM05711.1 CreA family protein [Skermanella rosea]